MAQLLEDGVELNPQHAERVRPVEQKKRTRPVEQKKRTRLDGIRAERKGTSARWQKARSRRLTRAIPWGSGFVRVEDVYQLQIATDMEKMKRNGVSFEEAATLRFCWAARNRKSARRQEAGYRRLTDGKLRSRRKKGLGYRGDPKVVVGLRGKNRGVRRRLVADDSVKAPEADDDGGDTTAWKILTPGRIYLHHVHALAILISTFHYSKNISAIDWETFAEYTARTAFERPLLSGVAVAQRVVHSKREKFEKQHGWTIKTMEKEPSPIRDEYAPVISSQETVSYIESLDMMSGEEDRESILRSGETGKAVLTNPFRLLGSHHLGVVLTIPVYKTKLPANPTMDERTQATASYLGGAFDVESLVGNLLGQLAGNQAILVNVYDITNYSDRPIMYGHHYEDGVLSLLYENKLDFGDPFRKHQTICRHHQKTPTLWTALTTAFLFFAIGLLVGYILYGAATHIVKIKDDFHEMQELKGRPEAAEVAKSQFLANVSHKTRTPMKGILGMLALLLDTELSSTQRDYAQTAQACEKALIALINEVLDRAKIEAGKLELEGVAFDLRLILDDVLSLFFEKSRHKGVELVVFVSDIVPEIFMGDPGRFRQVITNLVGNSVKFTEQGHIFVKVQLAEQSMTSTRIKSDTHLNGNLDDGALYHKHQFETLSGCEAVDNQNSWDSSKHLIANEKFRPNASSNLTATKESSDSVTVMISVEDTGIGIPLRAQGRVFMPFLQADGSTSRNDGGTGIGLSISKCLVELMGGQMNFVNRPQVGSTFSFTAAFRKCEKKVTVDIKKSNLEELLSSFRGLEAVVVDGKPVRAAVTKYHMKRLGTLVEVASSVKRAAAL